MANGTFLDSVGGKVQQIWAVLTSAGPADADKLIRLGPDGKLDLSLLPPGVIDDSYLIATSETLSANDIVNVFDTGGGVQAVRRADGGTNKFQAHGIVIQAYTHPTNARIFLNGIMPGFTALTPGLEYYLSTTPGQVSLTPPSAPAELVHCVGVAMSTTELDVEMTRPVHLAPAEI